MPFASLCLLSPPHPLSSKRTRVPSARRPAPPLLDRPGALCALCTASPSSALPLPGPRHCMRPRAAPSHSRPFCCVRAASRAAPPCLNRIFAAMPPAPAHARAPHARLHAHACVMRVAWALRMRVHARQPPSALAALACSAASPAPSQKTLPSLHTRSARAPAPCISGPADMAPPAPQAGLHLSVHAPLRCILTSCDASQNLLAPEPQRAL